MNLKIFQAKAVVEGGYLQPGLTGKDELRRSIANEDIVSAILICQGIEKGCRFPHTHGVYGEISIPTYAYLQKTICDISGCGVALVKPGYRKSPTTAFPKFKFRSQSYKIQQHFVICNVRPTEIYQPPWLNGDKGQILVVGEVAPAADLSSIFESSSFHKIFLRTDIGGVAVLATYVECAQLTRRPTIKFSAPGFLTLAQARHQFPLEIVWI